MSEYFFNCNSSFIEVKDAVNEYLKNTNLVWMRSFGIQVHLIDRSFFTQFEKLDRLMSDFGCHRHCVFRFPPNTCYGWHSDNRGRTCALNMLLSGTDSHTFYGTPAVVKENDDYEQVKEVVYEDGKFTLMNVQKNHTVVNLNNMRYLLTISFHPDNGDFGTIKDYLTKNNF